MYPQYNRLRDQNVSRSHNAFRIIHSIGIYTHNASAPGRSIIHPIAIYTHNQFCFYSHKKKVQNVIHVTYEYEERLRRCQNVPRLSYGRRMLTEDGAPNRFFLMYLFCNESMTIQYLKDIELLRSKMQCNTCGRDMA